MDKVLIVGPKSKISLNKDLKNEGDPAPWMNFLNSDKRKKSSFFALQGAHTPSYFKKKYEILGPSVNAPAHYRSPIFISNLALDIWYEFDYILKPCDPKMN